MSNGTGVILVHGYTGYAEAFDPLAADLAFDLGPESVEVVRLPGHCAGQSQPEFLPDDFVDAIEKSVKAMRRTRKEFILIGHSTGGILALSFLKKTGLTPSLLVLAATPRQVDASRLASWQSQSGSAGAVPFISVARLAATINKIGSQKVTVRFPVLMLYGDNDELVPLAAPYSWSESDFSGPARRVTIPGGHDLFGGRHGALARDIVRRAVRDSAGAPAAKEAETLAHLKDIEPEIGRMVAQWPPAAKHISRCPSAAATPMENKSLRPLVPWEPVFANIEVSTRCNLSCIYCARRTTHADDLLMSQESFDHVLDVAPSAYRVTLVGLGEPLLHPGICDLVARAHAKGRRVGLVTNGMCLDDALSGSLLKAGLHSIAFSIDACSQELASTLRPGADMKRIVANIRTFMTAARRQSNVSTAIFCALSSRNVGEIESIIELAIDLGVHALMLTDLNFLENANDSLWKNAADDVKSRVRKAVAKAFQKNLPVLSVHGLESFGLFHRYREFLLIPPDALYSRSPRRTHCVSPWQTLVVTAEGKAGICDCQPAKFAGDLSTQTFSEVWNGETMVRHREAMLSGSPPAECIACPRF